MPAPCPRLVGCLPPAEHVHMTAPYCGRDYSPFIHKLIDQFCMGGEAISLLVIACLSTCWLLTMGGTSPWSPYTTCLIRGIKSAPENAAIWPISQSDSNRDAEVSEEAALGHGQDGDGRLTEVCSPTKQQMLNQCCCAAGPAS